MPPPYRPATRRAVHPVDHVVADVHRVRIGRQHFDLKGVAEAGRLECLVPPRGAFDERAANRLRGAVVDVIDDRLDRLGDGRGRVLLLEAMSRDPPLLDWLVDRRRVVVELDPERRGAGVELSRLVVQVGQLDERVVLAQRDRDRRRGRLPNIRARILIGRERQNGFDLGVLWKPLGARHVRRAAAFVEFVFALMRLAQAIHHAMCVPHEERGRVDQRTVALLGFDLEPPEHALGKRVFHCAAFGLVARNGAVVIIRLNHQDFLADSLERDDARVAQLPPIQADRIGSQACGERDLIEHLLVEPPDLHEQLAGLRLPIERQVSVDALQPLRLVGDGGKFLGRWLVRLRLVLRDRRRGRRRRETRMPERVEEQS